MKSRPLLATELLEKQHRKVEAAFKKLESKRTASLELLRELANDLAAHMAIEQEIFYPAVREVDEDLILEAYEEHSLAELAIKRLMATELNDESFPARVTAAKELIEHHVEEEEGDLFPEVEKALGKERLAELGEQMKERFEEVLAAGFEAAVPKGFSKTSADVAKSAA
ncbi:MAG TPA: hemerythrin domain-containing protein [Polyangiaceae bacterium]|jgi:hemerythrin-like domain-containing protein|nr:hemerythrin domain-containing protein [Polyangiaceae bacterium]